MAEMVKHTLWLGQWIDVGGVKVKFNGITSSGQVKLAIDAPKSVRIRRAETLSKRENDGEDRSEQDGRLPDERRPGDGG